MPSSRKRIAVLGSTGSIGTQTLDVVRQHPDKLKIVALSAFRNEELLCSQAREFGVTHLALGDESVQRETASIAVGSSGVEALASLPEVDLVVNALVGAAGLRSSLRALSTGKVLALANKESLVVGGDLIMPLVHAVEEVRGPGTALLPIDSEHGAIFQCLLGEKPEEVRKLWITASGGPFRGWTQEQLRKVTAKQALAHPTWHMGPKITVDSSTLMNKGLEVIEAHHLFNTPYSHIEVVVQPQSVVHSMVEFIDGSVKAHLGTTDMRIPIQFTLSFPERWDISVKPLDFKTLGSLQFEAPDTNTFRCLALAREAGMGGGTLPCVLNAANEVAVAAFLDNRIAFPSIAACVESVMETHNVAPVESIEQLREVDYWARREARRVLHLPEPA